MDTRKNMLLAVLCLTHLSAGLETKLCKHEKTVDAIRNIYGCLKDFQKDFVGFWLIGDRTEGKKNLNTVEVCPPFFFFIHII